MKTLQSKHIVFVTGAFVTHHGWDPWKTYFEAKGYTTVAPPWPYKDSPPNILRDRRPYDTDLALMTLEELVDYYIDIVEAQPEKPIVIGHSLGGLITQIIVNRGFAAAGVAIHSVPPLGIIPYEFSFIRSGWKALGLLTSTRKTYLMSFSDWQYAFVNGMPLAEQKKTYEENAIPESKTVARGGLTKAAKVDFKKPHVPLLLTSGDIDNIIPAHLNKRNFDKYAQDGSLTEYKEFPGRNHFVLGQASWSEDAAYIAEWLEKI
ncbi:MAG: alpha/beta hydrolase [Chryseolinea sp.]